VVLLPDMLALARPVEVRYYLGSAHYRSLIDYSETALADAAAAYQRIEGFLTRGTEIVGAVRPAEDLPRAFVTALDDDLNVPQALAVVHEAVREGNTALAVGDLETTRARVAAVRAMTGVLGLDPLSARWSGSGTRDDLRHVVDALVTVALQQRQAARERRDFAAADAIREALAAAGIVVEDTPNGPRWDLKRG
jgi:cysteinyl-tRNA synthetase